MSHPLTAGVSAVFRDPVQAALQLRAQGRLQEALEMLSSPGASSTDFCVLRGDLQRELGLIKEAAGSYFTVTAAEPENIYAQCNLGLCLHRLQRWEQAAEAYHTALKFDPHRDEVRLDLGDCLLHLKKFEEALACFDQCWSDGARRRALFGRAVALQRLRRFDEAEANYERLLTLDPKAEEALSNLIALSLEVFDLARIQKFARRLLDLNPHSGVALKALTLVALETRDFGIASGYFFRAVDQEPAILEAGPGRRSTAGNSLDYRIERGVMDILTEAARRQPGAATRAAGAR